MSLLSRWIIAIGVLAVSVLGCSRIGKVYWGTLENPPVEPKPAVGPNRFVVDMSDDDIIVWVDGSALTKAGFDQKMREVAFQIERIPNIKNEQRAAMYKGAGRFAIPGFIEDQIAIHEARRRRLFDAEGLKAAILKAGEAMARTNRMDYAAFAAAWPGGQSSLNRYLEEFVWKKALAGAIPPLREVDDKLTEGFHAEILADNARCAESNRQTVARLEKMRRDVMSGTVAFEKLAEAFGNKENGESPDGYWGEFAFSDFSDKDFAKKIFSLNAGEVSEVLEDDSGFCLVKMIAKDSSTGEPVGQLARISLAKELMAEVMPLPKLKVEIQRQMHEQALDKLSGELRAKAVVVYPSGTNHWDSTRRRAVGGKQRTKGKAKK